MTRLLRPEIQRQKVIWNGKEQEREVIVFHPANGGSPAFLVDLEYMAMALSRHMRKAAQDVERDRRDGG